MRRRLEALIVVEPGSEPLRVEPDHMFFSLAESYIRDYPLRGGGIVDHVVIVTFPGNERTFILLTEPTI